MIKDLSNLGAPVRERVGPALNAGKKNAEAGANNGAVKEASGKDEFSKVLEKKTDWPRKTGPDVRSEVRPEPSVKLSPKTPQDNETSAKVDETENGEDQLLVPEQEPAQRQTAILKFMDSMESEFGVPPEKIVEAMANLEQNDQLKSPEETALQVIDKLELEEGDRERALALYLGLLTKISVPAEIAPAAVPALASATEAPLAATSMQDLLKGQPAGQGQEIPLSTKERRALLNDSLDRMSSKFFRKETSPQAAGKEAYGMMEQRPANLDKLTQDASLDEYGSLKNQQFFPDQKALGKDGEGKVDPRLAALLTPVAAQPLVKGPDLAALQQQQQMQQQQQQGDPAQQAQVDSQLMPGMEQLQEKSLLGNQSMAVDKAVSGSEVAKGGSLLGALTAAGIAGVASKGDSNNESGFASSDEDSGDAASSDIPTGKGDDVQFFPQQQQGKEVGSFAGMMAAGKAAGTKESSVSDANMEKLVGQAKIVASKGGGEAIVKLNPEGLGEVKLKISVKDGRVQVEMATESNEAKKMLESTVGDLKHALTSHKLSVDSIKVDVGNQLASEQKNQGNNSQDQSMNFRQDPGREQARQFFANMREENMARREPFMETNAVRDYQRPVTPIAEKRASPASRYAGTGRGEKMNIVA